MGADWSAKHKDIPKTPFTNNNMSKGQFLSPRTTYAIYKQADERAVIG